MKILFEGAISCKAVLESKHRKCECLYVDKKKRTKDLHYTIRLAEQRQCPLRYCSREEMNRMAGHDKHGGILLEAQSVVFSDFKAGKGFITYINGVEDPYHLGSICRTLYASGCSSLILPDRDWSGAEKTIVKASAGAFEKLPIYQVSNDKELIVALQAHDIPLVCAHRSHAKRLYEYSFASTFCLAIGGALRGLSAVILQASIQNVYIEYGADFKNALDTPSATAIMAFEILRQRMEGKNAYKSR